VKALVPLLLVAACQTVDQPRALPALDEPYFRCRVQPILTKDCATFACHGDGRRYFRVFARNRLRAGGTEKDRNAALTEAERAANFDAARAVVDPDKPSESPLLKKPLEAAAGGWFHRGALIYNGGNVFLTAADPDYTALAMWVAGAKEDPTCVEPGSDQ
jgi:hypothetical protein